ncbi:MAG: sulfotransferase domain-containing protein [Nitrosomonas sp.]|uniref:sulfotransferase family protein n=1 Tax=Nitrosomonas sp. TaxID=42353 RepID=UPI0027323C6F|nr:sulfotransferase domain-containing protein [Nitrosomonas sp.]MDP1941039.1 sulfotransferase domain-containing protein [Gallionella sp.]MDP3280359.1 sulfotransferase domain-containing protein [Nitrosomonas sp.]MDP3662405.1 sulfotransferase domain-containing protein [Nitrosomonas sp.]MDZ4106556.1 sulfotransferase domain-containing protein [Nitrosomonas sp.]
MKPTFIGLGAQKCASTWMYRVLQDHPEAAMSEPKELDYFSYYYGRGYYWYEQFFADIATNKKAVGEISPSYLPHPLAPQRAYLYNPGFRIILAVRDPVERAYSNHLHMVKLGYLKGSDCSFEYGLKNNPMYVEQSRYATHLAAWLTVFPRNQVLVLFQEDIRDTPLMQARTMYRFLGLAEEHQPYFVEEKVNESISVKNNRADDFLKQIGQLGRSMGVGRVVEVIKRNDLIRHLRRRHNQIDLRKIIPPLREDTKAYLQDVFADDMRELAQQLGRKELPWPSWRALLNKSK